MTLKPQNFEPLLAWLDAGCPRIAFNMEYGYTDVEDVDDPQSSTPEDCGSACCIAGFVYQEVTPQPESDPAWSHVEAIAAEHLGLTPDDPDVPMGLFHYDLFDPNKAPDNCTPAQAAEAVRRVLKGEAPWT